MGVFHLVSSRHFKSLYACDYSVTTSCLYHLPPLQCSSSFMSLCLNQLKHLPSLLISFINCCIDPQGECFANYQHNKCQLVQTLVPDFTYCTPKAACSKIIKRIDYITNYVEMEMQSIWQQLTGRKNYSYSSNVSIVLYCILIPMNNVFSEWRSRLPFGKLKRQPRLSSVIFWINWELTGQYLEDCHARFLYAWSHAVAKYLIL